MEGFYVHFCWHAITLNCLHTFEFISFKQVVCFQGIMLVYDITNDKSFENIKNWIRNIEEVGLCVLKCIFNWSFFNNNMICWVIMFYSGLNTCYLHLYQEALIKFVSAVCLYIFSTPCWVCLIFHKVYWLILGIFSMHHLMLKKWCWEINATWKIEEQWPRIEEHR